MNKHIDLLGLFYIIWGGMGAIALVVLVVLAAIGVGLAGAENPRAVPVLGSIAIIVVLIAAIASLPNLIAGYGLIRRRPWARILTIILSFVHLAAFPLGTALGAYGIWVLFEAETVARFASDYPDAGQPAADRNQT